MKHFLLKFNHGVEIGARLAYLGHFQATGDIEIMKIADDEMEHRSILFVILMHYREKPSPLIDGFFTFVGTAIMRSCPYSPRWALDFIARSMELFAVVNYSALAIKYPLWNKVFNQMSEKEDEHKRYFSRG
jgi:rubrerythrin